MTNPLAAKLQNFAPLGKDDIAHLDRLCVDAADYRSKRDLIKVGDRPDSVFLLLKGWACRYKLLPDGKRQVMAFLVPGDLCDVQVFTLRKMDHSIGLLSDARVAKISKGEILDIFDTRPMLARALWWSTLTDEAVLREWLVNLGQRNAYERVTHLIVEMHLRLQVVGLATDGGYSFPMTQMDLGDTLGLTSVHTNRVLQRLRKEGLIDLYRGRMTIPSIARLRAVTRFDDTYLHHNEKPQTRSNEV